MTAAGVTDAGSYVTVALCVMRLTAALETPGIV
jgi:hypothetical protein